MPVKRCSIPDQLVDHAKPDQSLDILDFTPVQMASAEVGRGASGSHI